MASGVELLRRVNVSESIKLVSLELIVIFYALVLDIDCGPLPTLEHGSIRMSENRTTFGIIAQYICHENYTLIGNENRSCTLTGWTGKHPQCLVDWCPEPPQINGGKIKISGRRAGSTVTYTCDDGYVLIGEDLLSCGLGGEWTGKSPVCRYVGRFLEKF